MTNADRLTQDDQRGMHDYEIEAHVDRLIAEREQCEIALDRCEQERDRLRAALELYADEEHWRWTNDRDWSDAYTRWNKDGAGMDLARAILAATRPATPSDQPGGEA